MITYVIKRLEEAQEGSGGCMLLSFLRWKSTIIELQCSGDCKSTMANSVRGHQTIYLGHRNIIA